jgi:hypothetical protein
MFDDDEAPVTLTINKSYANKYENWREKEEKQKRKGIGVSSNAKIGSPFL